MDFVAPGRLGTQTSFSESLEEPIKQAGLPSASRSTRLTAKYTAQLLRSLLQPYMLRRTKNTEHQLLLPCKNEQVVFCYLTPMQYVLYVDFLDANGFGVSSNRKRFRRDRNSFLHQSFFLISVLRKICNHVDLLLEGTLRDQGGLGTIRGRKLNGELLSDLGNPERSGKLQVAISFLKQWKHEGHRALFFSQTVQFLNLVEPIFQKLNFSCRRIDGTVSVTQRSAIVEEFTKDPSIFMLLLTTRVGGVGLNLMAANRVLIFDPDWNPMCDAQARERAWRIGQKKEVGIYSLILANTIEEKVYQKQVFKQLLSLGVLEGSSAVERKRKRLRRRELRELFELPSAPPQIQNAPNLLEQLPIRQRNLVRRILGILADEMSGFGHSAIYITPKRALELQRVRPDTFSAALSRCAADVTVEDGQSVDRNLETSNCRRDSTEHPNSSEHFTGQGTGSVTTAAIQSGIHGEIPRPTNPEAASLPSESDFSTRAILAEPASEEDPASDVARSAVSPTPASSDQEAVKNITTGCDTDPVATQSVEGNSETDEAVNDVANLAFLPQQSNCLIALRDLGSFLNEKSTVARKQLRTNPRDPKGLSAPSDSNAFIRMVIDPEPEAGNPDCTSFAGVLSHPDFDLEQKRCMENAQRAFAALGAGNTT